MSNKKINATDIDLESQRCFYRNVKLNSISILDFTDAMVLIIIILKEKIYFNSIQYTFITIKKLAKDFKKHLASGGILIVSGILHSQMNDIVNCYSKFNLKLVKSIHIEGWVSLIFKKYAIN